MTTFLPPASRCLAASSRLVHRPVDSMTTSTPISPQGSSAGSRSARTLTSRPSTVIALSPASTVPGKFPNTESYLSRWASVPASVMSLTATISTSASDSCAARKTLRPMRPKPLMPTRTGMVWGSSLGRASERRRLPRAPRRHPVDIPVGDFDEVRVVVAEMCGQVLRDDHGAVSAAGASDGHHQMRLALGDVLRQQVLEQRDRVVVELLQAAVAADVVDDPPVEAGERAQVGLVV